MGVTHVERTGEGNEVILRVERVLVAEVVGVEVPDEVARDLGSAETDEWVEGWLADHEGELDFTDYDQTCELTPVGWRESDFR